MPPWPWPNLGAPPPIASPPPSGRVGQRRRIRDVRSTPHLQGIAAHPAAPHSACMKYTIAGRQVALGGVLARTASDRLGALAALISVQRIVKLGAGEEEHCSYLGLGRTRLSAHSRQAAWACQGWHPLPAVAAGACRVRSRPLYESSSRPMGLFSSPSCGGVGGPPTARTHCRGAGAGLRQRRKPNAGTAFQARERGGGKGASPTLRHACPRPLHGFPASPKRRRTAQGREQQPIRRASWEECARELPCAFQEFQHAAHRGRRLSIRHICTAHLSPQPPVRAAITPAHSQERFRPPP